MVEGATFDAAKLNVIAAAFDSTWNEVAASVGSDPQIIEAERSRLAAIILTLAEHGIIDLDSLKSMAERIFRSPSEQSTTNSVRTHPR